MLPHYYGDSEHDRTPSTVSLQRADGGTSKIRRSEDTKLRVASAAAGLRPATREARGGGRRVACPAGAVAPAGSSRLFLPFDSSILRFFAVSRGLASA